MAENLNRLPIVSLYASSVPAQITFFKKEWFSRLQKVYHVAY